MSTVAAARGPLSIGDIADRSVTLAVRRWRTLFALVLIDAIPFGFVRVALPDDTGVLMLRWFLPDLALITFLYVAAILTVVAVDVPSPRTALASAVPFVWKGLAAVLLSYAWLVVLVLLILIVAALAAVPFGFGTRNALIAGTAGAALAALVVIPAGSVVSMIAMPVMIIERLSPWTAFTRSFDRVRRTGFVRASLLGFASLAILLLPCVIVTGIADYGVGTLHLSAVRLFEQFAGDAVTLAFGTVFATVAALEIRARTEGADLEAELVEHETAVGLP